MKVILIAVVMTWAVSPVSVQLKHPVIDVRERIEVSCIVDRKPDNRFLDMGLQDDSMPPVVLQGTTIQLDGEDSPRIFTKKFQTPCDAEKAFCTLRGNSEILGKATAPLVINGCQ